MTDLGKDIKKLGFGLMRLPMKDGEIDIEQTKIMTDMFIEKGFTYFDTAYGYNNGKSEEAARDALVRRYPRDKFLLATKLPAWAGVKTADEAKAMLETSLKRTEAGYFDFYLLHNLGGDRTAKFDEFGLWDYLLEKKKEGLIRHLGFSFHDGADELDKVLTAHPQMEFVQLQINYADWESPSVQSRRCYETARRHGKQVVIMEPVKGGALATAAPRVSDIFKKADPNASLASWAIRFAASLEGVITVLSGMSDIAQMRDNLSFMENFKPLSDSEKITVEEAGKALDAIPRIPCTGCRYCTEGCPAGVKIPDIFDTVNSYLKYNNLDSAKGGYGWATRDGGKASECLECGQCESVCPQHIGIIGELKKAYELFEK